MNSVDFNGNKYGVHSTYKQQSLIVRYFSSHKSSSKASMTCATVVNRLKFVIHL